MLNVIALGNLLKGDDAIGPRVIEKLVQFSDAFQLNLIDAGTDAITVLEYLTGRDPVLIIDCAKMGRTAGEIVGFDITEATISHVQSVLSLHGFGFGEIYQMALSLGPVAPCKIIGIEPGQTHFNDPLSREVEEGIPQIIDMVKMEAQKYGQKSINN